MLDVIIIGAGAGGSPAAWKLVKAGLNVALLELGDEFNNGNDLTSITEGGEYFKRNKFSSNPNSRKDSKIIPEIISTNSAINPQNYYGIGGSTLLHSCMYPRLHETDFRLFSCEGILENWPLSYSELLPYYNLDVSITGVSGKSGNPFYPEYNVNMPCVPIGKSGRLIANAFTELNWQWWPSYAALNTIPFDGRISDNFERPSNMGPADSSKGSVNNTYLKKAIDLGLKLLKQTYVKKLIFSKNNKSIESIYCLDTNTGKCFELTANTYILSCGGLHTPYLLMNSVNNFEYQFSDQLGRNLMLHPWGYVEGTHNENMRSNYGPQGCCITSQEFCLSKKENTFKRGYTLQVLRGPLPIEYAINQYKRNRNIIGNNFVERILSYYNKTTHIAIICDDFPERTNRVKINDKCYNKYSMPSIEIDYKLSKNSAEQLGHGIKMAKIALKLSGAIKTRGYGPLAETGWHILGTCRMGNNPKNSVVNKYGKVHSVSNLYVSDASLFVTGGSANPCATIQALSLYIADNLINSLD